MRSKFGLLVLLLLLLSSIFIVQQSSGLLIPDQDGVSIDQEDDTDTDNEDKDDDDSDDKDEIDEETREEYEREVEVERGDREWRIESSSERGENEDEFEAEFKIGGGDEPEIEMEYSSENSSSEVELRYRVNFDDLIEFSETDNQPGYSEDNDTVVSIYELDKADWNALSYSTTDHNGATVHTATATTTDGIFTLVLKLSTGITDLNNTIVTPNAIKIDIVINDFDYQQNNTYLALQTDVKSESEMEIEEESEDEEKGFAENETQLSVSSSSAKGFFSWLETADADNQTVDVISTTEKSNDDVEAGETNQIIFFTFDIQNPKKIIWDPKIGVVTNVNGQSTPAEGFSLPFSIAFVGIALLVIPLVLRKRE